LLDYVIYILSFTGYIVVVHTGAVLGTHLGAKSYSQPLFDPMLAVADALPNNVELDSETRSGWVELLIEPNRFTSSLLTIVKPRKITTQSGHAFGIHETVGWHCNKFGTCHICSLGWQVVTLHHILTNWGH
jgi:hypothetical protein